MKKNNLITQNYILLKLLQSFQEQELNHFEQFVSTKYFNTDQRIIILLRALRKDIIRKKAFDDHSQAKVFTQVFDKPLTLKILNQKQKKLLVARMSDLTKLAKRFLAIEALNDNKACEIELLQEKLLEKKLFSLARKESKKNQKKLAAISAKKIGNFAAILQNEIGQMNVLYKSGLILKEDNLTEVDTALDLYYLINKLKLFITASSIKNVSKKSYDFATLAPIKALLDLPQFLEKPIIKVYLAVIHLIENKQESTYFSLLSLLNQYAVFIPDEDLKDFYKVAVNFSIHQIRTGNIKYSIEVYKLYYVMDHKNILLEGGTIDIGILKNIVTSSCHVEKYGWANQIVEKYYPYTKKTIQNSVYHFNLGVINFYQKNYQDSISHLIRVDKINLVYDLDCRLYLLKAHFQLDTHYDERTTQILRSAERFIVNHQVLPTTHKKSYKNFIKVLINLYRVKHQVGKKTLDTIHNDLLTTDFITDKKWLLNKIAEIKIRG